MNAETQESIKKEKRHDFLQKKEDSPYSCLHGELHKKSKKKNRHDQFELLSISLSIDLSLYLALSTDLSTSLYLPTYLARSTCLPTYLSISLYLYIYLPISVYLPMYRQEEKPCSRAVFLLQDVQSLFDATRVDIHIRRPTAPDRPVKKKWLARDSSFQGSVYLYVLSADGRSENDRQTERYRWI